MTPQEYFNFIDNAYLKHDPALIEADIRKIVELSKEEYGENTVVHAAMLSELGAFFRGQRKLDDSIHYFKLSIELLEKVSGTNTADYATGLDNLGSAYRLAGRFEDAKECFNKCLEIYRNNVGEKHILYAAGLNNLGMLALDQDDTNAAANYFEQCSLILKEMPEAIDEYTTTICNTASLYYQLKDYPKAEALLIEAIDKFETILGVETPHYHAALNTLGLCFSAQGEFEKACFWFKKSVDAANHLYSHEHLECQAAEQNLKDAQSHLKEK